MTLENPFSDTAVDRAEYAIYEIEAEITALMRDVMDVTSRPDVGGAQRGELLIGYRDRFMQLLRRLNAVEEKLLAGDQAPHLWEVD